MGYIVRGVTWSFFRMFEIKSFCFGVVMYAMVLLANNDCAIDRTRSSSKSTLVSRTGSMIKGSGPFYWTLLKEATCS